MNTGPGDRDTEVDAACNVWNFLNMHYYYARFATLVSLSYASVLIYVVVIIFHCVRMREEPRQGKVFARCLQCGQSRLTITLGIFFLSIALFDMVPITLYTFWRFEIFSASPSIQNGLNVAFIVTPIVNFFIFFFRHKEIRLGMAGLLFCVPLVKGRGQPCVFQLRSFY